MNDEPLEDDFDRLLREYLDSGWADERQPVSVGTHSFSGGGVSSAAAAGGIDRTAPRTWTTGTEDTWVDADDAPFTPIPRPGRPWASMLMSIILALTLLAGLGWLIIPEIDDRINTFGDIELSDAILTAQPVYLSSESVATVEEILIDARRLRDEIIPKGTRIARLSGRTPNGLGTTTSFIVAPFDARFVSIDAQVGSVTHPGAPVVTLYDPAELVVLMSVKADQLTNYRRGMVVRLRNSKLPNDIDGVIDSAVPLLGTDHEVTTSAYINIRVIPEFEQSKNLIPGIRFEATVRTDSVADDAPEIIFTSA